MESVCATYIKCDTLYIYESEEVRERSCIMYPWAECLPFSRLFTQKTNSYCNHSTLMSFLSYSPLEMTHYVAIQSPSLCVSSKFSGDLKPYFYSFCCHGYLRQGSWLEATINSALSSIWQICFQTDNLRRSLSLTCQHVPTMLYTHLCMQTHTQGDADRWMTAKKRSM